MSPSDVPVVTCGSPSENERRLFGGFLVEGGCPSESIELAQFEVPVGIQRAAAKHARDVHPDLSLSEVLEKRSHSDRPVGFWCDSDVNAAGKVATVAGVARVDVLVVLPSEILLLELKTHQQAIDGMHDIYEGFGQILMNVDRFTEDYPSIVADRPVRPILVLEESGVDYELLERSFREFGVQLFDPRRGGYLLD